MEVPLNIDPKKTQGWVRQSYQKALSCLSDFPIWQQSFLKTGNVANCGGNDKSNTYQEKAKNTRQRGERHFGLNNENDTCILELHDLTVQCIVIHNLLILLEKMQNPHA